MNETPRIQYCTTSDGVNIAYATTGAGPHLVWVSGIFTSHIPTTWRLRREAISALATGYTVTLYDGRGSGLSDREQADFSLGGRVRDLEAVIAQLGASEVVLYAGAHAGLAAIEYAAEHPDRVSKMVLDGAYVSGDELYRISPRMKFVAALENVTADQWTYVVETMAVRLTQGVSDQTVELAQLIKDSVEPEALIAFRDANRAIDLTDTLPRVAAPTLVVHRVLEDYLPISVARRIAAGIPDAHLVTADQLGIGMPNLNYIADFLGLEVPQPPRTTQSPGADTTIGGLRTILFTDLVSHTDMMTRLGDAKGREVLRQHERITREVLAANGGTELKTMGDGFMASFGSVTKAVGCAVALQRAFAEHTDIADEPLHVRVGLNAGEPIEEDGDLFGSTVILASRIAARAEGGEILVSDNVRSLCSGKGFLFSDRGEFVPKGFEDAVRVYEVSWRE